MSSLAAVHSYLEHGAFYAILALAAILLVSARYPVPDVFTGLIGAVLIGLSLWGSARYNRANPDIAQAGASDPILPDGSRLNA